MKRADVRTMGSLTVGTVINYTNLVTADDINYVVLRQYENDCGKWTEVLDLGTFEKDAFTQHTLIRLSWSIVKEN